MIITIDVISYSLTGHMGTPLDCSNLITYSPIHKAAGLSARRTERSLGAF